MREFEDKKVGRLRAHSVVMENRERVSVTGIEDVDSFNEEEVVLVTEQGQLTIVGQELHICKLNLDDGQLIVEGFVLAVEYDDVQQQGQKSGGFFSRLLK